MSCLLKKSRFALSYFLIHTKKILLTFIFAIVCGICGAKPKIISSEPCEYRDVSCDFFGYQKWFKDEISCGQAEEDLDYFVYLLKTGYSGYDLMVEKGFDENDFKNEILKNLNSKDYVSSECFAEICKDKLKPFINDSHFQIIGKRNVYTLSEKFICYWSDCFVEKKCDKFYSINCKSNVPVGLEYKSDLKNLFYYPAKGKNIYRIGALSSKKLQNIEISFNDKIYEIEVKEDGAIEKTSARYKTLETDDSAYIALNSFYLPYEKSPNRKTMDIIFNKFIDCGNKYKNKKNIILDMRSNEGGNAAYLSAMFFNLYSKNKQKNNNKIKEDMDKWFVSSFSFRENIVSPLTCEAAYLLKTKRNEKISRAERILYTRIKKNPEKRIEKSGYEKSRYFKGKSLSAGKIIILTDRNSCSAGEIAIPLAKDIFGDKDVLSIGENTFGAVSSWNTMAICLPNSKIGINTAFAKNLMLNKYKNWHGEGKGFYPDYWSTGEDLNETIFLATNDKAMKEKLGKISERLL